MENTHIAPQNLSRTWYRTLIMFALILFRFYVHAFKTKVYTGSTVISVEVYMPKSFFFLIPKYS